MTNWTKLQNLTDAGVPSLNHMFKNDPNRAERMRYHVGGIYADFSKQRISPDVIQALCALAQGSGITEKRIDFFAGKLLNTTEKRAVLHPALRGSSNDKVVNKLVSRNTLKGELFKIIFQKCIEIITTNFMLNFT